MKGRIEQYHFSEITPSLAEELALLNRSAYAKYKAQNINLRGVDITGEQLRCSIESEKRMTFIFFDGDKMVACTYGSIARDAQGVLFLYACGLACLPEYSKKGCAPFLVKARERWAKKQGAEYARLDTATRAEDTKKYHHACGYKDWYYGYWGGKHYISIVMRKDYGKPYPTWRRLLRLCCSYIRVRARYSEYGELTLLTRIVRRIRALKARFTEG